MSLSRMKIEDSDSDSDLMMPVRKKAKDQVKDLKKIIQLNSSARKKRQNYNILSCKLTKDLVVKQVETKIQITVPEFVKQEFEKDYFKTNVLLGMIKTGKFKRNSDNFKWLMHVLIKYQTGNFKNLVINVLEEFLKGFTMEKRWEFISEYKSQGKVVLEVLKRVVEKGNFEFFKEISRDEEFLKNGFVEVACIFKVLLEDLEQELVIGYICELKDPRLVINVLKVLNHLKMEKIVKESSQNSCYRFTI